MEQDGLAADGQIVLILVGLIASGKSTFAQALQAHFPRFQRCNQDDLGNRRLVEQLTRQNLRKGNSVCIDRTNFDAEQRAHWIRIAHEFPGTSIWIIVFDTPYEVCASRLQTRTAHPTIKSPELGLEILARFARDLQLPVANEGYDRLIHLNPSEQSPSYTATELASILDRLRNASPPHYSASPASSAGQSPAAGPSSRDAHAATRGTHQPRGNRGRGSSNFNPNANAMRGQSGRRGWGRGWGRPARGGVWRGFDHQGVVPSTDGAVAPAGPYNQTSEPDQEGRTVGSDPATVANDPAANPSAS